MAKIWFRNPEGEERPYVLDRYRTLRIGRDPGNDIVLRDARVSRQHAEIMFQRGFFVLHDLASANGSFVNGRRIRVAPLTNGSELKIGNTLGRFADDPPAEDSDSGTIAISMAPPASQEEIATLDERKTTEVAAKSGEAEAPPFPPPSHEQVETTPNPLFGASPPTVADSEPVPFADDAGEELPADGIEAVSPEAEIEEPVRVMTAEIPMPDIEAPPPVMLRTTMDEVPAPEPQAGLGEQTRPNAKQRDPLSLSQYVIDTSSPDREKAVIRDSEGQALFYFRRPIQMVGCMASLVGGLVLIAGIAATALLVAIRNPVAAAAAAILTIVFTILIFLLVPRRSFQVCHDEAMTDLALLITQESRLPIPSLRFAVRQGQGPEIVTIERSALSRFARHRWVVREAASRDRLGYAVQSSLARALLQNVAGTLFGALRTGFRIYARGKPAGEIGRPPGSSHRLMVNLAADPRMVLDRRAAIALAVVIDAIETR